MKIHLQGMLKQQEEMQVELENEGAAQEGEKCCTK
jgi:hypothetical protein